MTNEKEYIQYTAHGYNIIADEWDQTRQQTWPEINSVIEKYIKNGKKIIDIGCGNGRAIFLIEKYKNIEYLGIDNAIKLIEKAKKNFPNFQFEYFNGINFSKYKKNYYDVLLCIAVIHHIPEKILNNWLKDINKLIKKNAIAIFTSWDIASGKSAKLLDKEKKGLLPFMHYKKVRFVKSYEKDQIEKYLKQTGFKILKSEYKKRESGEQNIIVIAQKH